MHYHLLLELVRQGEPPGTTEPPPERDNPANVERRARAVLERLKHENSLPPSAAVEALEELAMAFEAVGLRNNPTGARLPLLCAEIAEVVRQVVAWGDSGQEQERLCGKLLGQAAELTLRCARAALGAVYEQQRDLWALVHRWRHAPDQTLGLVERPEWLLDGWSLICGIWRAAERARGGAARRAAAFEMAGMVPVMPMEARDWVGFDAPGDMANTCSGLRNVRRTVRAHQDWMTGRMVDLALRNERVRAIAA